MLGGMSWESSAEYYRLANEYIRDALGGAHSASILLDSVDFADIEAMQSAGEWDRAGSMLAKRARALEAGGADILLLCTNTMHKVAHDIDAAVSIPLLHIADTTATAIRSTATNCVGLLGTAFTMEQDFYRDRVAAHGIEVIVPDDTDRAIVHRVIYDELVQGIVRDESRIAYRDVIARLVDRGAEGIILGCTEIELLVADGDSTVPLFPTARLHVQAAVELALSKIQAKPPGSSNPL